MTSLALIFFVLACGFCVLAWSFQRQRDKALDLCQEAVDAGKEALKLVHIYRDAATATSAQIDQLLEELAEVRP